MLNSNLDGKVVILVYPFLLSVTGSSNERHALFVHGLWRQAVTGPRISNVMCPI